MKLKKLIQKLTNLHGKVGDLDVRIDFDENDGWYDLEKIKVESDDADTLFINIISSNEA